MSLSTTKDILRKLILEFPDLMEEAFGVKLPSNNHDDMEGDEEEEEERIVEEENEQNQTIGRTATKLYDFIRNLENDHLIKIAEECPNLEVLAIESKGADITLFEMVKRMPTSLRDFRLRSDSGRSWEDSYILGAIPTEKMTFPNLTHVYFDWIGQYDPYEEERETDDQYDRGADNYSYYQQTVDTIIAFVCSCPNLRTLALPSSWKEKDMMRAKECIPQCCPLLEDGKDFFHHEYPIRDDLEGREDVIEFSDIDAHTAMTYDMFRTFEFNCLLHMFAQAQKREAEGKKDDE